MSPHAAESSTLPYCLMQQYEAAGIGSYAMNDDIRIVDNWQHAAIGKIILLLRIGDWGLRIED